MTRLIKTILFLATLTVAAHAADSPIIEVRKIWDAGAHNAFTDLIRWKGAWWCTFRESDGHVGGDGKIRVITSKDGDKWESAALVEEKDIDLRDPKFSITPDSRLMIVCGGSVYLGTKDLKSRQPRVLFSKDGKNWTTPQKVLKEGDWLWRVTWYAGKAYGVSYDTIFPGNSGAAKPGQPPGPEWTLKLYSSTNGLNWDLVSPMEITGRPNETTVRFQKNGDIMAMVRREAGNGKGWVGVAHPPYKQWTWHENDYKFGGPNFIQLPDGSFIGGTRDYSTPGKVSTLIARMTPDKLDPIVNLPSSGDNSYPGLVWQDGTLWVSYYSSHEGKTSIYLAKVKAPIIPPTQRVVAIDNVCAWPNLMTLRDGSVMATIFNYPAHGAGEGDVDCWVSADGRMWTKRATVAPHEPGANRMNLGAGQAKNGDLVVISSGWSLKKDAKGSFTVVNEILEPWVCRSTDDGRTWTQAKQAFPAAQEGFTPFIPFGDILAGGDGALRMSAYARDNKTKRDDVWFFRSDDDGRNWKTQSMIGEGHNETAVFHLGGGKWLVAARSTPDTGQRLDLFRSDNDGKSWKGPEPVTAASQHPAHLQRLKDGRLLLTYGNRLVGKFGVQAKLSSDDGKTWGEPVTLVDDATNGDCGYPSSVQLKSGEIVSAYYARGVSDHQRYHMGAVIWTAPGK